MSLGHPRRLRVVSELISRFSSVSLLLNLRLGTEGNSWRHECWFKQLIFWFCHMDSPSTESATAIASACQVSDHSQMMCGGYKVDIAVVDIALSHPTHQSPSEGLRIRPKLKMHYAGTMADSNAYILKIDGTTTRSVCSIGVACSSALLRQSGTENRRAVPLGLPTFIAEALSAVAAEQFFSGHQWLFSGAFQEHLQWCSLSCGLAIFCWQHMSCHLFKHMMVVTRVTLVSTR